MKYPAVIFAFIALGVTGFSQTSKPRKPTVSTPGKAQAAKPKAGPTPKKIIKTVDEKADFDAAWAPSDPAERTAALKKFLKAFPNSTRISVVNELLSRAEFESANAALQSGDAKAAAALFVAAANDSPSPIPEQLFAEVVSKIPAALFWRGERIAAIEAAAVIESKASPSQLLELAGFYMSIENGAEAKRIAAAVIEKQPTSAAGYETLGLANRIDFQLDESAAAYARALELDPGSATARRGLAEMKRALGLPDEAAAIYRELLAADASNIPARTGLVLSLFEGGKRSDAESELAAALDANPGNVMLLAGAAYWYAAHGDGGKAIELAQKAISTDPRFIWSHIALAHGYMAEKQPLEAERVLLAARRYGNFPTLSYEIASARLMAGFYREAAEELAGSFSIKDGLVTTKLGGRIAHESTDMADVIALERKASISAPISADSPETSQKLLELLDLWLRMEAVETNADAIAKAADAFAQGDDVMRVHRELFAASELLDRRKALAKASELARAAVGQADGSLNVPSPEAAVMADALYDNRRLAVVRNEYIRVPDVPRTTLLNIVRGRIEELNGRALFESGNVAEAVTRLKRAVSVLPVGSSWWRSSTWRLGAALEADGKAAEALDAYIRSYKSGGPDLIRYSGIATLYRKLNGNVDGLEAQIGPDPAIAGQTPAANLQAAPSPSPEAKAADQIPAPSPEPSPEVKTSAPAEPSPAASPAVSPEPTPELKAEATPEATPAATPAPSPAVPPEPTPESKAEATPEATPAATPAPSPAVPPEPTPELKAEATPEATPAATPAPSPAVSPEPTPELKAEATPEATPAPTAAPSPAVSPEPTPELKAEATPEATPAATPAPSPAVSPEPTPELKSEATPEATPAPTAAPSPAVSPEPTPELKAEATPEATPAATPAPSPAGSPEPTPLPENVKAETVALVIPSPETPGEKAAAKQNDPAVTARSADTSTKELFPPVIITIPAPGKNALNKAATAEPVSKAADPAVDAPAILPCKVTLSEPSLTLQNSGGDLAVIIGTEDDRELAQVFAISSEPKDVEVRREPIAGISARALFVVRSISTRTGVFSVTFKLPCGQKELSVKVR